MSRRPSTLLARSAAPVLVLGLLLAGCSGDAGEPATSDASTPSATSEPPAAGYLPAPADVSLTPPGTGLEVGQSATVAWQFAPGRVGVVALTVDAVEQVRPEVFDGWLREGGARSSTPYFVEVTVENRGSTELGGEAVPLYLRDDTGTLGPPWTFGGRTRFGPCSSQPLPGSFSPGDEATRCLVYLAPRRATLEAMAFVPVEGFDPIQWTGKVKKPARSPKRR